MHRCEKIEYFLLQVFFVLFLCNLASDVVADEKIPVPAKVLENTTCMECHEKQDKALVNDWLDSAHATAKPAVDCTGCHGQLHKDIASRARHDEVCIDCHGGRKDPIVHSYLNSKHGVLMRLEKNSYNWGQSFESANYRAPGCGYCHMNRGNHNVSITVRHDLENDLEAEKVHSRTRVICQDCHSPRYITLLFNNGETMLEIGRKKVREASRFIQLAASTFAGAELLPVEKHFERMQRHLKNVYLGTGHQSPDYQWWHGQPALDGDLLRIKDALDALYHSDNAKLQ